MATASRKPRGCDVDLDQAHESALKEAETDAMKRALMTFGNPFGLALHDKAQRQVSSAAAQGDGPQRQSGQRSAVNRPAAAAASSAAASPTQGRTQPPAPAAPPSAPADPGQVSLDPDTIQHLHSTLRALPRPQQKCEAVFALIELAYPERDRSVYVCMDDPIEAAAQHSVALTNRDRNHATRRHDSVEQSIPLVAGLPSKWVNSLRSR
ncbi:MAG: Rad52/Rad22 family DNA repair protein [Synechococcaceae cyanobacterium]|nr:Rad52/Rad22 family DNA repair protein [Synechococcaceae cyanobacterium]